MAYTPVLMQRGASQVTATSPEHYFSLAYDGYQPVTDNGVPRVVSTRQANAAHGVRNMRSLVHFAKNMPAVKIVSAGDGVRIAPSFARPDAATVGQGTQIYDNATGKPLWSDGESWRDAMGTVVT